ncbi:hypothetical protein [Neolewinella persica]|uniref:hypothetical protein n=1 Tax=Neolewinella persica TaxID=70998 RepID=UPI0003A2026A|nr:hypothetical protein [Neolewinella persica]
MIRLSTFSLAFLGMLFLSSCSADDLSTPAGRYKAALKAGLSSSTVTNDLFLGLQLAETDKEFYDRCTELNGKQLIEMGSGGNRVNHKLDDELARPAVLTFYPDFSDDRPRIIKAMDLEIAYVDWSPWNKAAYAGPLLEDIGKGWASQVFGEGFEIVSHARHGKVLVQVKNNRRTAFWVADDRIVRGRVTDLRALPDEPLIP